MSYVLWDDVDCSYCIVICLRGSDGVPERLMPLPPTLPCSPPSIIHPSALPDDTIPLQINNLC